MDEQDYIEINNLLTKLRIICLKTLDKLEADPEAITSNINRKQREQMCKNIRNIDSLRRNMPLEIDTTIEKGGGKYK